MLPAGAATEGLFAFWTSSDAIELPFQAMLGRGPSRRERDEAAINGVGVTARRLAGSAEHLHHLGNASFQKYVLACSAAALEMYPPGTLSPCRAAMVSRGGGLLLRGGSNTVFDQLLGRFVSPPGWLGQWRSAVRTARDGAAAAGARLVQVVLPEGLALQSSLCAGVLELADLRPVERLLTAEPELLYPLQAIRSAPGNPLLLTDSHFSPLGSAAAFSAVMEQLGLEPRLKPALDLGEYLYLGDLGMKFRPQICEVALLPTLSDHVETVEDRFDPEWSLTKAPDKWRIVRNRDAPCDARVLVFGDSHSFPPPPGVGGSFGDLLTRAFTRVHYRWSPFGWDPRVVAEERPDIIIQEITERFVTRAPDWAAGR